MAGLAIVAVVILAVVVSRSLRPRPLRLDRLWIRPAIFAIIVVSSLGASAVPSDAESLAILVLALGLGVALGWQRGRLMRIDIDPETHLLSVRASPLGMLLILGLLGLKVFLRGAAMDSHALLGVPAITITDGLMLLLGATVVTQSLEMWLRARQLLASAQAAKSAPASPSAQPPIVS
jgi:hypothetical protein